MIRSFARPARRMKPSPSTAARSPVSSQPSVSFPVRAQLAPGAGIDEVAGEDVPAAQHQGPDLVLFQEGPGAGQLVDRGGAGLLVGEPLPDRARPGRVRPAKRTGARPFSKSVALAQRDAGPGRERVAHRGWQWSGSHDRQLQAGDVGVDRNLREHRIDRGDGGHRRDPVALDDLPEVLEQREVAVAERARPRRRAGP